MSMKDIFSLLTSFIGDWKYLSALKSLCVFVEEKRSPWLVLVPSSIWFILWLTLKGPKSMNIYVLLYTSNFTVRNSCMEVNWAVHLYKSTMDIVKVICTYIFFGLALFAQPSINVLSVTTDAVSSFLNSLQHLFKSTDIRTDYSVPIEFSHHCQI